MAEQNPSRPHDASCIFCKIAASQIPSYKVYEDAAVFCFLDIGPLTPGHCLVIPKAHYRDVLAIPPAALAELAAHLPRLARAALAATGAPACHVLLNSGVEAMQSVPHLHFHIIPRKNGDSFRIPWHAGKLDSQEAATLAARMKDALAAQQNVS